MWPAAGGLPTSAQMWPAASGLPASAQLKLQPWPAAGRHRSYQLPGGMEERESPFPNQLPASGYNIHMRLSEIPYWRGGLTQKPRIQSAELHLKLIRSCLKETTASVRKMAFDGNWKVDRSENYEKFMEQMGINVMKRKLGAHDNLKITIQQEGNKFTVKESSTFRTIEIIFMLGVNFEYSLADGTELGVRNPLLYKKPVFNKVIAGMFYSSF
ncbi:hypothetical protein KIL84_000528 [Mauremys mutica]|uniref:Cytosolic fatty-acid binding proteins domain-containing protein n=1 Tax=Mauremys mutica TaxID=74926 RepID=A0A9D4AST6_9SAUR|nr:hypothetical protein KIL84_000528 [Mauremys mutica]